MRMMEWFDMVATDTGLEDKYPSPPVLGGAHKREWCRGKGLGDGMRESVNEEESEFGGEDLSLPACLLGRRRITYLLECVACVRLRAGHRDDQRDRTQGHRDDQRDRTQGHAAGIDSDRSQGEPRVSLLGRWKAFLSQVFPFPFISLSASP
jgi:hypothetical protein